MKRRYIARYFISLSCLFFTSFLSAVMLVEWTHFATPDVVDRDLSISEDLQLQEFSVLIQAMTQSITASLDFDIHLKGYKYSPCSITFQPINLNNIVFDLSEHSLHFKGKSHHHTFTLQKNMGNGYVEFNVSNGNRLKFSPKG